MKVLFVYPRFSRHAEHHPELREHVPMNEYMGSPSLGIACIASATGAHPSDHGNPGHSEHVATTTVSRSTKSFTSN